MPKVRHEPSAMTINQSFQGHIPEATSKSSKTIYPRGENEVLASEASEARSMMLLLVLFHLEQMSTSLDVVPIGTNHLQSILKGLSKARNGLPLIDPI
jgi:hypothetical protein